jgi:hypothetical protein
MRMCRRLGIGSECSTEVGRKSGKRVVRCAVGKGLRSGPG